MHNIFKKKREREEIERILEKAMRKILDVFDEPPSFSERLKIAGCSSPWEWGGHEPNALETLFQVDNEFYDTINLYTHEYLELTAEKIPKRADVFRKKLSEKPPTTEVSIAEIESTINMLNLLNPSKARRFLVEALEKMPENPELLARHAAEIHEKEPEHAREMLEFSLKASPFLYINTSSFFILQYYMDTGNREGLKHFLEMREEKVPNLTKMLNKKLKPSDRLIPVEKDENLNSELCECLSKYAPIKQAYLVSRIYNEQISLHTKFCVLVENTLSFSFVLKHKNTFLEKLNKNFSDAEIVFIYKRLSFCDAHLAQIPGALFYDRKSYRKRVKNQNN